jgi:hypothetical protein
VSSWLPYSLFFNMVRVIHLFPFSCTGFLLSFLHTLFEIARDIQVKCIVKFWGMLAAQSTIALAARA